MNLSWGKPRIFVKDLSAQTPAWVELNTPVEDSTELQPTKGDKLEAKIEGGQNEDVRFKDTTYTVVYNIRKAKNRAVPLANKNGVCNNHYAFCLMPEDNTNIGFYIAETSATVDDTFTAADGAIWSIQHEAIAPLSGNTVKWGTVAIASSKLTFTETHLAEGQSTATTFEETVTVLS